MAAKVQTISPGIVRVWCGAGGVDYKGEYRTAIGKRERQTDRKSFYTTLRLKTSSISSSV
jgi:hypothetical protein